MEHGFLYLYIASIVVTAILPVNWHKKVHALSRKTSATVKSDLRWKPDQDENGCDMAKQCTEYVYSSDLFNETVVTQVCNPLI